ncbi:hypothetical protein ACQPXB_14500 [Amycolatopsis sp. CA-161197]|uniref:hypothetical protein n=1 Tax=Amycolatopsis sp. CA-161197 TaxID=3239922 RepID=UPI003D8F0C9C
MPEEQAKRQARDDWYDEGMNSAGVKVYQQRQQEDAAANAAAAGGGYVMDAEPMRKDKVNALGSTWSVSDTGAMSNSSDWRVR